jgi:hypothetical protein
MMKNVIPKLRINLPETYIPEDNEIIFETLDGKYKLSTTRVTWDLSRNKLVDIDYVCVSLDNEDETKYLIERNILRANTKKATLSPFSIPKFSFLKILRRNKELECYKNRYFLGLHVYYTKEHYYRGKPFNIFIACDPNVLHLTRKGDIILRPGEEIIEIK